MTLHSEGWSAKAIAGYLRAHKATVHRVLKRWAEEEPEELEDRRPGRQPGVRKVTLRAMEAVRRLQQNPSLGEFRVHAALAQVGIHLRPRTCGCILALNRELYGLEKPKGPVKEKREMPFAARRLHQYSTVDVCHLKGHKLGGKAYVISVLDNHARANLNSAVTRTQDLASYLSVLYAAAERYGSPEVLVTDGAGEAGQGGLRGFGPRQARDRARQALAELHRNALQHTEARGRLALWRRGLGRARRRGLRCVSRSSLLDHHRESKRYPCQDHSR